MKTRSSAAGSTQPAKPKHHQQQQQQQQRRPSPFAAAAVQSASSLSLLANAAETVDIPSSIASNEWLLSSDIPCAIASPSFSVTHCNDRFKQTLLSASFPAAALSSPSPFAPVLPQHPSAQPSALPARFSLLDCFGAGQVVESLAILSKLWALGSMTIDSFPIYDAQMRLVRRVDMTLWVDWAVQPPAAAAAHLAPGPSTGRAPRSIVVVVPRVVEAVPSLFDSRLAVQRVPVGPLQFPPFPNQLPLGGGWQVRDSSSLSVSVFPGLPGFGSTGQQQRQQQQQLRYQLEQQRQQHQHHQQQSLRSQSAVLSPPQLPALSLAVADSPSDTVTAVSDRDSAADWLDLDFGDSGLLAPRSSHSHDSPASTLRFDRLWPVPTAQFSCVV